MIEKLIETNSWLLLPLFTVLCGALIILTWVVAHYFYYTRQAALEARLKHDMLERGMSVEQIERVLWVSGENQPPSATVPEPDDPVSNNQVALVERMLDDERDLGDIERLLRALRPGEKVG